jgi:hypothetical protein
MDNYCWQWLTRQSRPLVREGAQQRQHSKIQTELISVRKSQSGLDAKTDWMTVSRNVTSDLITSTTRMTSAIILKIQLHYILLNIPWSTDIISCVVIAVDGVVEGDGMPAKKKKKKRHSLLAYSKTITVCCNRFSGSKTFSKSWDLLGSRNFPSSGIFKH